MIKLRIAPASGLLACALSLAVMGTSNATQKHTVAQASPAPATTPAPVPSPVVSPSAPSAQELLTGGAALPTPGYLPYPAYGSPAPGVNSGEAKSGIPAQVTLADAIAIGVATSPLLATARADAKLAAVNVDLARTAILPNLYGSASLSRNFSNSAVSRINNGGAATGGGTTINGPYQYTSTGVSGNLSQLIFDGGRTIAQIQAASRSQVAAVDTYRRNVQTVAYNVATAYFNLLAARRTTYIDVELVRQNQVQEDLVRAQLQAGTVSKVDLATAELPTARARLSVVQAQGTELTDRATLANVMGLDANTLIEPPVDDRRMEASQLPNDSILNYNVALKRALALRPDYDSAVKTVEASEKSLLAARLGYSPSVTGSGSFGTDSTSVSGGDFRPQGSLGLALNFPVFNQGITRANIAQAQANLDVSRATLKTTEQTVQLNVKQALVGVVSARAGVSLANVEVNEAVAVLEATRAQYRAGVTTLPLLLNAQVQLTQSLTDQTTALYTLRQAEQQLLYAIGENVR
jgi:outer membrane protein